MRLSRMAIAIITALISLQTPIFAQAKASGDLMAAAGKVDITPSGPAYMAGYGLNRHSLDAHDRLTARCLILQSGEVRIGLVACDLVGLPRYQIERIRALVSSVTPNHLFIAATHTHSGPDTMGQWGPDIRTSGVDQAWMGDLRFKIAHLVDRTASSLRPAELKFASTTEVPRTSKNIRVPRILDTELSVMQVVSIQDGKAMATLLNYACHPEILNNRHLTADFPHWIYETVERTTGGTCLFFNGALGGMVTADYDESTAPKGENWAAAEPIGTGLGNRALEILKAAEIVKTAPITTDRRVFSIPLENVRFKTLIGLGVFPREVSPGGMIETEVSHIRIGPAEFVTAPGEALPNIGLYIKGLMHGKPNFLFGLTGDELGYILTPEDYGLPLYSYETSVSVGPETEPRMVKNIRDMLDRETAKGNSAP